MDHRFVDAVRAVDPDVTSDELADIVWLAAHARETERASSILPTGHADLRDTQRDGTPAEHDNDQSAGSGTTKPPKPESDPAADDPGSPSTTHDGMAELRLPPRQLTSEGPGVSARSPTVPAIHSELQICRALLPLQRRVPSLTRTRPDETATAEWIAETGLWASIDLPISERWLDVALVVDGSASMAIWARTVNELRTLLQRTGAFRDVRVWHLDGDTVPDGRLSISGEAADSRRDPRELIDPTGRRLILIASDCVGQAWASGAVSQALTLWASAGPTAIIQMLPQRLWANCVPEFVAVRMRSLQPGVPNGRLGVESRSGDTDGSLMSGLPIPVLELEDRWLKPWAALVSGTAGDWVNGAAVFAGSLENTTQLDVDSGLPTAGGSTPQVQLRRFRAHASPDAFRLMVCLAAAPLSLAVMRLVQGAMVPSSRPAHLAEVFLSGLLRRVGVEDDGYPQDPDDIEYDFAPGIRDELLFELQRPDALQVLAKVSNFVSQRLGSPLDFRALLTSSEAPEPVATLSLPFAQVAYQILDSLGGRYAEAAQRLAHMAELARLRGPDSSVDMLAGYNDHPETEMPGDNVISPTTTVAPERGGQTKLPGIMRGVPSRNRWFTGRSDLLDQLHKLLVSSTERAALLPHTLHGLGGVGKTQLAVEYVYRYASEYDVVCWIPAQDLTEVRASLVELGAAMGLPDNPNVTRAVEAVLDALRTSSLRWLLIFDNADRPADLQPYLPYPTGHVLITSRNAGWTEVANAFEVDVFDREESKALLRGRLPSLPDAEADQLAARLGDLPLALEQASAWLAETAMPVDEYLRLFDDQFDQLTEHPPSGYPVPVGATYRLALDRLREQAPGAAQLLDVLAFFGAEPIPVKLLWDGRDAELTSPLDQTLRDEISFRRALREIGRYALARVDASNDTISIHRLVQVVLRARLNTADRELTRRTAQNILAEANPSEPDLRVNWPRHGDLSPHILPSDLIGAEKKDARLVVLDQIRYRWVRGDYESGRQLGELAVAQWKERWGEDDDYMLLASRHLAMAMRTLGDYQHARELAESTLARMRQRFGDDHGHTLVTADSVAWDLRISGKFDEAKALDEENLTRLRRLVGDDDPQTLKSANNFAVDLRCLGRFAEAREVDDDQVRRRRVRYGDKDRNTQLSVNSLARDLYGLGEYTEGLRLQEEALEVQQQILGPHHAEVLLYTRNLAILLRKVGRYTQARDTARELVRTYEARFGEDHEHALAAKVSYCNALRSTGELDEAQALGKDTLERYQRAFGQEHPNTLTCASNLAIVLRYLGSAEAALALNEASLDAYRRVLGLDHPSTLCCATNTSNDLAALHRHEAARELSEDTYRRSVVVRGEDHPYTLACALNTALDRRSTGDEKTAEPLLSAAITGLRRRLGETHPETMAASTNRRADCDIEPSET